MPAHDDLARMIYRGELINGTNQQMLAGLPRMLELFKQVSPFREDEALIDACTLAILRPRESRQDDTTVRIREYLTRLQTTMCYEGYHTFDPARLVRPIVSMEDMIKADQDYPFLVQRYNELKKPGHQKSENLGLASVQKISGDGNCYFRAVLKSHLENAIVAGNPDRKQLFEHLATLMRQELLKPNSLFRRDHSADSIARLEAFVVKLNNAANGRCWIDLHEFAHDFAEEGPQGDDYVSIDAARYCVGQYITDYKESNCGGLLISVLLKIEAPDYMQNLLTNEKAAEGFHVNAGILPAMIGSTANNILVSRDEKSTIQINSTVPLDPSFEWKYHLNWLPKTETNLLLKPGHYDLFYTQEQQRRKFEMQAESPMRPFNFTGVPAAWATLELDEDRELADAIALSLEYGHTDSEKTSTTSSPSMMDRIPFETDPFMEIQFGFESGSAFRTSDEPTLPNIIMRLVDAIKKERLDFANQPEKLKLIEQRVSEFLEWAETGAKANAKYPILDNLKSALVKVNQNSPTSSTSVKARNDAQRRGGEPDNGAKAGYSPK